MMVSIIVPVYNVEKYIRKCVESLCNQTLKDIEIILVDDGSTDMSGMICDQYAKTDIRIRVIHQENSGQGAARNRGLEVAKGEWIGFVDADDWVDLDFYRTLCVEALENKADMAVCNRRVFNMEGKLTYQTDMIDGRCYKIESVQNYFFSHFFQYTPSVCNKIFKANLIKDLRFASVQEVGSEDTLFNFEVMLRMKRVIEVEGVFSNQLARENSTARSYKTGALTQSYHLLCRMLEVSKNRKDLEQVCFCVYNYFNQRAWKQIQNYAEGNKKQNIKDELKMESGLPRIREFSIRMVCLSCLDRMGYRWSGKMLLKAVYLLKILRLRPVVSELVYRFFVCD